MTNELAAPADQPVADLSSDLSALTALIPVDPSNPSRTPLRRHPISVRDEGGLMLDQRRLLLVMVEEPDWQKACKSAKIKSETFRYWLARDERFRTAVNGLFSLDNLAGRALLDSVFPKVVEVYDRALDAESIVEVDHEFTCEECDHVNVQLVRLPVPNWSVRLKAADTMLKRAGQLVERREVKEEHSGMVLHAQVPMSVEDFVALARIKRGLPISEAAQDRLTRMGAVDGPAN